MITKKRLDVFLHEQNPQYSRRQIQSWIMQGKVSVDDRIITKAGTQVTEEMDIVLSVEEPKFVSRAGLKLEKALDHFNIDVTDLVVLDAGISTGGFTDCLLQRGAQKVFGIDVGYGQVADKIRNDERVVLMERTNLRTLNPKAIGEKVDLVTLDLSFISLLKVIDAVAQLIKDDGQLVTLIKPQFEAGKHEVGRGGVITDPQIHEVVVKNVINGIEKHGFQNIGVVESPIFGASGNKEFLAYFKRKKSLFNL